MNFAPYRFSMEMAVNRQPLWDFLGLDIRTRNSDWATDLDAFKSSTNYSRSDWREKFITWVQNKSDATTTLPCSIPSPYSYISDRQKAELPSPCLAARLNQRAACSLSLLTPQPKPPSQTLTQRGLSQRPQNVSIL